LYGRGVVTGRFGSSQRNVGVGGLKHSPEEKRKEQVMKLSNYSGRMMQKKGGYNLQGLMGQREA